MPLNIISTFTILLGSWLGDFNPAVTHFVEEPIRLAFIMDLAAGVAGDGDSRFSSPAKRSPSKSRRKNSGGATLTGKFDLLEQKISLIIISCSFQQPIASYHCDHRVDIILK